MTVSETVLSVVNALNDLAESLREVIKDEETKPRIRSICVKIRGLSKRLTHYATGGGDEEMAELSTFLPRRKRKSKVEEPRKKLRTG